MYTVYKITNLINEKIYVGVHKTEDPNDSYMGSGVAIRKAIEKHGKENFKKTIILKTESKDEAYALEKTLTENFGDSASYNMKQGGVGGFSKEDSWKGFIAKSRKGGLKSKELGYSFGGNNRNASENGRKGGLANKGKPKPKSEAHIQAIKEAWRKKKLEV